MNEKYTTHISHSSILQLGNPPIEPKPLNLNLKSLNFRKEEVNINSLETCIELVK